MVGASFSWHSVGLTTQIKSKTHWRIDEADLTLIRVGSKLTCPFSLEPCNDFQPIERNLIMSGLCGVVSKGNCSETLLFGTDYHSHLGNELAGMAVCGESFTKKIRDISKGQFKSRFEEDYPRMLGGMGIGVISDKDAQPLLIHSRFGTYALAVAGFVENKNELTQMLFQRGAVFTETSGRGINSIEILAKLIEKGEDFTSGLEIVFDYIQGSASMLALTRDGVYAVRDRLGRTPLILGEREDGAYMVATERSALMNLDFDPIRELGPGEIVFIQEGKYRTLRPPRQLCQTCAFLWIYTGYPASCYEGVSVEQVRERCGAFLAKRDTVEVDLVAGVPDSGMGHAVGYAMESRIPLRRPLVKYTPGYGRSYIPPTQIIRDHVAKMKLIAVPEIIKGNRVLICEDSIVRGTQLKNFTVKKLWNAGAKEVHVRSACPPPMFPCRFALSTRSVDELITRRAINDIEGEVTENIEKYLDPDSPEYAKMIDWICKHLDVTTLRYQRLDDMIEAIGLPKDRICHYCWTGESEEYNANSRQEKLDLL